MSRISFLPNILDHRKFEQKYVIAILRNCTHFVSKRYAYVAPILAFEEHCTKIGIDNYPEFDSCCVTMLCCT